MNFVFISPNFPDAMRNFCVCLKENGITVLGIGDAPYDTLHGDLKYSLTEYFRVDTLEDYEQMRRAVGYFIFHYGKIDWLESNNEYWLEQDARLRTDFNITTGPKSDEMGKYKSKLKMKAYFAAAGVPAAEGIPVTTKAAALEFAARVGYPLIVKPDSGVGADDTHKLIDSSALCDWFSTPRSGAYLMEPCLFGAVTTFDGICGPQGEILFAASHTTPESIMDMVNEHKTCFYYVEPTIADDVRRAGTAILAALGAKSRCFHLEFFRLTRGAKGIAKRGELVALEINMRPAGGFTPDMINYACSGNCYQMYADMVAFGQLHTAAPLLNCYCAYFGRRDAISYLHSNAEIMQRYRGQIEMTGRMPAALADAMGDQVYIACFDTMQDLTQARAYLTRQAPNPDKKKIGDVLPVV